MSTSITITALRARMLANVDEKGKVIPNYVVAAHAGVNPSQLSQYAMGRAAFTQKNLDKLCRYFQCDPNELSGYLEITFPEDVVR